MIYSNPFSYPFAILIIAFNDVLLLKLTFSTSHSSYIGFHNENLTYA